MQTLKKASSALVRFLSTDGVFLISICILAFVVL